MEGDVLFFLEPNLHVNLLQKQPPSSHINLTITPHDKPVEHFMAFYDFASHVM
jgi:hypothetical protein